MNAYRVVIFDHTEMVDVGSDWFEMPETENEAFLVQANTPAQAKYRALRECGYVDGGRLEFPKLSVVCTRKDIQPLGDGAPQVLWDAPNDWWETEKERAAVTQ